MRGFLIVVLAVVPGGLSLAEDHPWLGERRAAGTVEMRIPPPSGFERPAAAPGSFAAWLRGLPLKPGRPPVRLHDGRLKRRQGVHHAVLDIDAGDKDLQQCADAVIRLRAEYLFSRKQLRDISFDFTSGDRVPYVRWLEGERPVVSGNKVTWMRSGARDDSYAGFRRYLEAVFNYAGTLSLSRQLQPVPGPGELEPGDVFIQGGSPGHAVIVLDAAVEAETGRKVFLLAQSYMPAQDIHVLKNPSDKRLSPWYPADFGKTLKTPEWTFADKDLRRF